MTYNQIIKRIQEIALAHRQVRNFYKGLVTDFLSEKTTLYPSVFLNDNGSGNISTQTKSTTFPFRLFILDLVHLSEDAKQNEQDVVSDMMSIAIDFIAQLSNDLYTDWRLSKQNTAQFVYEDENDFIAGVMIDFSISVQFTKDQCSIPTDGMPIQIDQEMKIVYDLVYTTNGTEGSTLTIPELLGKRVMLVTRESLVIYKVSNNPNSTEYVWDNTNINLGLPVNTEAPTGERFLILYRNY